ncbi:MULTISPECIES: hypothetical protein [Eubacteriales]|uniref:hypothetical protein n=1 Tax=Eubacteriales TaxID=186802 RepID=UPI000B3AFFFF|nr:MULTISPECIES: hypothetical protein [Eubacteriales]OUN87855.1 hypothetical protein B5G03_03525 [Gemmiger sp. An50]
MAQAAYELERFADRPLDVKPRMRAVQGKKQAMKISAQAYKTVAVSCVMVMLTVGLLQSQATLTQLTTQIQKTNQQLVNAQSDYNYLSGVLDSKTNLKNVEQIAAQLGLMKLDKSQITYVTLENESTIQRPESGWQRILDMLNNGFLRLMDHLDP